MHLLAKPQYCQNAKSVTGSSWSAEDVCEFFFVHPEEEPRFEVRDRTRVVMNKLQAGDRVSRSTLVDRTLPCASCLTVRTGIDMASQPANRESFGNMALLHLHLRLHE